MSTFFSKMIASGSATPTDRRTTPTISGPISKIDPASVDAGASGGEGESGADARDVGKTWSSMVDEGVLHSMGDRERKRQEVRAVLS